MEKNKKEQEKYTRLIQAKEMDIDYLKEEKRKAEELFQELYEGLHRGFRELSMLNEELAFYGGSQGHTLQQRNEEQERLFQQQLRREEEQVTESYHKEVKNRNDELENLYEKRRTTSWD